MRPKRYLLLLLTLAAHLGYSQSTVRVVIDSLPGTFGLNATGKQLYLINNLGGNHYTADTGTGVLTVFAKTDTFSAQNPRQYLPLRTNFFKVNDRYPVVTLSYVGSVSTPSVRTIGMNGVDYTLFTNPGFSSIVNMVQFPADTTAWFVKDNKVFQTNLTNRTLLIDSGKTGSYISAAVRPGHGGIYYINIKTAPAGGLDSTILMHHINGVPRRVYANSTQTKLFPVGMFGSDFYFLDFLGNAAASSNRYVTIRKCNASGTVTTVANLPTGSGSLDEYAGIGGGKLWFPVSGYNGTTSRNFFACDLSSGTIVPATGNTSGYNLMAFINNGSFSSDSFLYYRHLSGNTSSPDTMFRTKGTPSSVQRYGFLPRGAFFQFFDTSSAIENTRFTATFCDKYPVFNLSDTLRVGTDTGIAKTDLARSTSLGGLYEWAKIDKTYYVIYTRGRKQSLLKFTGCGIPQIQLAVPDIQVVPSAASIVPNPSRGSFQVLQKGLNHAAKCRLIGLDGREQSIKTATGLDILEIDATTVPTGMYLLQVQQGGQTFSQRIQIL